MEGMAHEGGAAGAFRLGAPREPCRRLVLRLPGPKPKPPVNPLVGPSLSI